MALSSGPRREYRTRDLLSAIFAKRSVIEAYQLAYLAKLVVSEDGPTVRAVAGSAARSVTLSDTEAGGCKRRRNRGGWLFDANGERHGFIWQPGNDPLILDGLWPTGIDNVGQTVVGRITRRRRLPLRSSDRHDGRPAGRNAPIYGANRRCDRDDNGSFGNQTICGALRGKRHSSIRTGTTKGLAGSSCPAVRQG